MQYIHFSQKQYGVFPLQPAYTRIGTTHVGPCVVLFLFNTVSKECFAFHIDAGTSIECIKFIAGLFLKKDLLTDNYRAFLIGGWQSIPTSRERATQVLEWLSAVKITTNVDFLFHKEFNGMLFLSHRNYIDFVGFDLSTGRLIIQANPGHDMQPMLVDEENELLTATCISYLMLANNRTISETIAQYFGNHTGIILNPKTLAVLQRLIKINNGTPAIPFKLTGIIQSQQQKLITHITATNIIGVIEDMYTHCASPDTPITNDELNNTPLHIACAKVNSATSDNIQRCKAIVLILLLRGRNNPKNLNGLTALDMLPIGVFKKTCFKLLQAFSTDDMQLMCNTNDMASATLISLLNIEIMLQDNPEIAQLYEDDTLVFLIDSVVERATAKPLLFSNTRQHCKKLSACDVATVAVTALAATSAYFALRL